MFGSIIATGFTFLATSFIINGKQYVALYMLLGLSVVGLICKLLVREILKKKRAGIGGTIFSFSFGSSNFQNTYARHLHSERSDRIPLVDSDEIDRIE